MSKETLKLALEALQTLHDENMDYLTRNKLGGENNQCMAFAREAITALRKALKPDFWEGYVPEPVKPAQQEPVAWMTKTGSVWKTKADKTDTPLYTSPPQQELVCVCGAVWEGQELIYTTPQRTWVDLTDEELSEVYNQADWDTVNGWEYERAIEDKLKEKNT